MTREAVPTPLRLGAEGNDSINFREGLQARGVGSKRQFAVAYAQAGARIERSNYRVVPPDERGTIDTAFVALRGAQRCRRSKLKKATPGSQLMFSIPSSFPVLTSPWFCRASAAGARVNASPRIGRSKNSGVAGSHAGRRVCIPRCSFQT